MDKLKPCPFCGGKVKLRVYIMFADIECNYCGINFSLNDLNWTDLAEYERKTIEAWNRRVDK